MTNYNERLDEIFYQYRDEYNAWQANPRGSGTNGIKLQNRAKQAITSLIKELVAEAKPPTFEPETNSEGDKYLTDTKDGYNRGVTDYEANLLKALEEV